MKWVVITISLLLAVINLSAQQTVTTGNLLRINFTKPEVDYSDTLWQWKNVSVPGGGTSETCLKGFSVGSAEYLLTLKMEISRALEERFNYLYNNTSKNSRQIIRMLNWIDPMDQFLYEKPIVEKVNNGAWLFFGIQRTALFVRNDSLYEGIIGDSLKIVHRAGKISDKFLLILQNKNSYKNSLCLADVSKSPKIKLEEKVEVWKGGFLQGGGPLKIFHIADSLYLYQVNPSGPLYMASFSKNRFEIIKELNPTGTTTNYYSRRYFYFGKELYYLDNRILYKETLDLNSFALQNKKVVKDLTELKCTDDIDSNYIAYYRNDSLFVYSIAKEKDIFAKKLNLTIELSPWSLDAPYIYYQQTKTKTGIEKRNNLPTEYSLSQNYPNPFNPETTISYQIAPLNLPKGEMSQYVTLKVYDVLGREVATLVNEYKEPGTYKEKFSVKTPYMASLQSGVYFYQLRVGDPSAGSRQGFVQTMKMLLIK